MRYAGFWKRAGAGFVDFIILLPLVFMYFWAESHSRDVTLLLTIPYYLSYAGFCIFFLARFGKTPGKMVMKLVVIRTDGTRIGIKEAVLRHSIDAIFGLMTGVGMLLAVLQTDPALFEAEMGWIDKNNILMQNTPEFAIFAGNLSLAWACSELFVLLFNKKRRAIHDFLAGTVVVHSPATQEQVGWVDDLR